MSNTTQFRREFFGARIMPVWSSCRLGYGPILVLLGVGILVRVILMIGYFPGSCFGLIQSVTHESNHANSSAISVMPAGYPMLLALLRVVSRQLWFTIAIQHVMGLGTGIVLFLSLRRLGAPNWMASIPAAVVFLSGDHLYFEHVIMADAYLIFLTAAGLAAGVYGLTNRLNPRWLCVASALLALAALARNVGIVLLPILSSLHPGMDARIGP